MCQIASLFLLQTLKGSMSGDARDFNNIETRAVIKFFFSARKDAEGNSRHSDGNIRGTCTVVRLDGQLYESSLSGLQKLGQRAKKFIELRGDYVE